MFAQRLAELAYRQSWQLALAAGIVWALVACLGKSRPHLKYLLWGAVLIKAMTPPLWASSASLFGGAESLLGRLEPASNAVVESASDATSPGLVPPRWQESSASRSNGDVDASAAAAPRLSSGAVGCIAWGVGAAMLACSLMWRYGRLIREVQRVAVDVPGDLQREVAELAARLGLSRPPCIYLTTADIGPAVAGVFSSKLILPAQLWRTMSPSDRSMVLTHELLHLARRDPLAAALQICVQIVWWFHPAVWLASRQFAAARELCCDAELLSREASTPAEYARCLLRVAIHQAKPALSPTGLVLPSAVGIKRRVAWITSPAVRFCPRTPRSAWGVAALVLLVLLPSHSPRPFVGTAAAEPPRADRSQREKDTPQNEDAAEPQVPSPELIAVTWQQIAENNGERIEQPVWRPDGTQLSEAEANRLLDQVKSFQTHWWKKDEELRPLVLVLRMPPQVTKGVLTTAVFLDDDRRLWAGSAQFILPNGLAKSALSPRREDLAAWPDKVDVDVKVPLENPQVIKRLKKIPDEPVVLAPGVRWYIDRERGIDVRSNQLGLTAAVLEIEGYSISSLVSYKARVWLSGQDQPLAGAYSTFIEPRPGVLASIDVSRPIDDVQKIERVEFLRQRFAMERIRGVKTRRDLLPVSD